MSVLANFLYSQFFVTPPYPNDDWTGKTVIVTGANVGLGLEAARHFARLGAEKVILGVRNTEKGETAKKDIETSTKRTGVVEVWQLDLLSYESVEDFASRVAHLPRLDAIVENAGIATGNYKFVAGNEATITTNVVSTFLLALLVLPKLKETAARFNTHPHLVIVSSEVHFFTSFPERKAPRIFDELNDEKKANMKDRYQVSKLLEVLACREIVKTKAPQGKYPVVINFLNPGLCHSSLGREQGLFFTLFKLVLARRTEVGARTLVHAASAGEESHGQYLSDCKVTPPAPLVLGPEGPETQRRVWAELSEKLEQIHPGILNNF